MHAQVGVREGVVLLTYSSLISAADSGASRLQQLVDWCGAGFEGLVVFDGAPLALAQRRTQNHTPAVGACKLFTACWVTGWQRQVFFLELHARNTAAAECHKAKNLVPDAGGRPTKVGEKVLQLQRCLPNARVVYCSATGARTAPLDTP
jgi:hypothetical protein